jgi:hypothetical protein
VGASLLALDRLTAKNEGPLTSMHHLSQTLHLINERLSGDNAVSDPNIAVVIMMAHYDRSQDQYAQGFAHVKGLQRMVAMRGGIARLLRIRPDIAHKILK